MVTAMGSMTRLCGPLLLALAAAGSASAQTISAPTTAQAEGDFAALAALVGEWRNAERPGSPLRIRFALIAGGTVLQESWFRGETLHSLTLYHRDGDKLIVTHYCPQGNQPTLVQKEDGAQKDSGVQKEDGASLAFTFRSATDLDAATESYLHDLSFDLTNPARPVRREVYRSPQGDDPSVLVLERV